MIARPVWRPGRSVRVGVGVGDDDDDDGWMEGWMHRCGGLTGDLGGGGRASPGARARVHPVPTQHVRCRGHGRRAHDIIVFSC